MASPASANGSKTTPPTTSGQNGVPQLTLTLGGQDADPAVKDPFPVVGWTGTEGISQLFRYELEFVTGLARPLSFDKVLGKPATLDILGRGRRHGIISRLTEEQPTKTHARYRAEMTSPLWFATKIAQSRVFQDVDVVEIIKSVTIGWPKPPVLTEYRIRGSYPKRPYCVQYRETDFQFLNRLMEEEGIYYFFHKFSPDVPHDGMVVSDEPLNHPHFLGDVRLDRDSRSPTEQRITDWRKTQEIRAGKYTLWDHSFELAHKHLEANKRPLPGLFAGSATHRFDLAPEHEIYDYPGGYAHHFDGTNRAGADQAAQLEGVFEDNQRTAAIRMEQEAVPGLVIHGTGTYPTFRPGYTFALEVKNPHDPSKWMTGGKYLITSVQHRATQSLDRSGGGPGFTYENHFTCIPVALPFRPLRRTPKPVLHGTQTAVVVGNGVEGEEILTDKYGRVKVRFLWDRRDPGTEKPYPDSCWIRVAQAWAGQRWGTFFWPRIGQEVVVAFLEGDPDRPIITGSVYNAEMMPPYKLPEHQTQSGIKTHSSPEGTDQNFNELRFEDKKGHEEIYVHAERALNTVVEGSEGRWVGGGRTTTVHAGERLTVDEEGRETTIKKGDEFILVDDGERQVTVEKNDFLNVRKGDAGRFVLEGSDRVVVDKRDATREVPNGTYSVTAKHIKLNGTVDITLQVGKQRIEMHQDRIVISAAGDVHVTADNNNVIKGGSKVKINCSD